MKPSIWQNFHCWWTGMATSKTECLACLVNEALAKYREERNNKGSSPKTKCEVKACFAKWLSSLATGRETRLRIELTTCKNKSSISSVHFSRSVMSDSLRPHESQHARPPLSITNSRSLLKLMSIESVMPCSHLILCHPLLLLPPIPPSIRVFSSESTLHIRWPKDWTFSFSISPSNEHPGLISFRMDWLDFLAVQGTLKSLLQHHSSKASILRRSAFFTVQLSHPYMTTGKTIALTRWTFSGEVMSLLFKMLPRLVITFLPRCKRLLISWL